EGRGVNGKDYVHLDLSHLDASLIQAKLPDITEFARIYLGVEPTTEPVPIQPTAHYAMGGIPTDVWGQAVIDEHHTAFPGLYAAGECACVSVHGANRLGTNSLLDIIVFGRRGGIKMAEYALEVDLPPLPDAPETPAAKMLSEVLERAGRERVAPLRSRLQEEMMLHCGVVRSESSLTKVLDTILEIKDRYERVTVDDKGSLYNTDLLEAMEFGFMLELATATASAARARTESRGGHYREDFPFRDDGSWLKHSLAFRTPEGAVELRYKPVSITSYPPMERKY
ncbi:MAG: FAD-binding protein, partial [Actinomycetota bacterium]